MSVISFGYKLWEGDVTLKDEVCQMLGYVSCKKWNVIDAVGNTHEIRIQQLRAGGKLAITDGLDNIMEFYNLTNSRHLINLRPISSDTFKIVKRFSLIPLLESFVAAALPFSSGEHYLVDEDNVEHPVELLAVHSNLLSLILIEEGSIFSGKRKKVDVKKKTDLAFFRIRYEALRH
ncbi:hypothetical protein RIF29_25176 [Crotalaria pallida]|uniref:Uncharacterized protein n=1 Tax=Crotalaria pallida TaxID=3830 RepID=A0AAN9HZ24_CROPI